MGVVVVVVVILLAVLVLVAGGLVFFIRRPLPQTRGTAHVPGLKGQVEIVRDRWGVAHIYADSADDLFFAQGYIHAQDRLWQMELQRRAATGRLSEITGEPTLEMDRWFRVVGLHRAAHAELEVLDDEIRRILEAYSAGVNAYMASRPGHLSLEFGLLRFEPEPWRPLDSVCMAKVLAWTLSCNWPSELIRARLAARLGADLAADLEPPFPADNPVIVPGTGLAPGSEPPPNGWGSEALRDALQVVEGLFPSRSYTSQPSGSPPLQAAGGSNQWVVDGGRSATGRPLLANDTHLQLSMPAGWYEIHLSGGEYHVTGVSFPGLPGVVVGHNQDCAWGLTTAWQDAQDLYVERLNPENPHQYQYKDEWLDADVVREEIRVKGWDEPVIEEVIITHHGPIISGLVGEEIPLALHWVGLERIDASILTSALHYSRARNWQEFRAALADWSTPAHNFVYADNHGERGNIGYLQAGWMPIRAKGHGIAPVPGWSGEYEWQGYLPLDELPQATNPESGWLATANHLVVGAAYPHFLSADLENPCRARRIADLITQSPAPLTPDDLARFQLDTYSAQAERFVGHLLTVEPQSDPERRALAYLRDWDFHLEPDSVAASIYQVARLRALHVVFDGPLGDLADDYVGLDRSGPMPATSPYHDRSIVRLLDLLDGKGSEVWLRGQDGERSRQEILQQALREALDLLQAELGPDPSRWTWGRLNRVHFAHPAGAVKPLHLLLNRGPYPMGGDRDTLLRAITLPEFPFPPVVVGDAVRFIADVSDWERCRIVLPGGQSGHAASRHYADLIPLWREGHFQPMPFAREQVERYADERLVLVPGAAEGH
jgi:penicillin amidase